MLIDRIILHFILLCSLFFYSFLPLAGLSEYLNMIGVAAILVFIVLHIVYGQPVTIKKHFILPILLIFAGVFLSTVFCNYYHEQHVIYSIWAQKAMYYYLGYFMLHFIRPSRKEIENIIIIYAFIFIIFYILQYVLYPSNIFDVDMREDRNTIRIALPGTIFILIAYFLMLQKVLQTNKLKYLFLCTMIILTTILMGGRQLPFIITFLTLVSLVLSKKIRNRFLIYAIIIISLVPLYFIFRNIIHELQYVTTATFESGLDDIRIKSARYYLIESFPNRISYITGNGAPAWSSDYGKELGLIISKYNYYLSDIGLIGNYYYYGVFFLSGVLLLIFKALKLKLTKKETYLKYFFVSVCFLIIMGGGFIYSEFIFPLTIILYLIDVSKYEQTQSISTEG